MLMSMANPSGRAVRLRACRRAGRRQGRKGDGRAAGGAGGRRAGRRACRRKSRKVDVLETGVDGGEAVAGITIGEDVHDRASGVKAGGEDLVLLANAGE